MTALVAGGAGFLGSHLCEHLLEVGQRVICVDDMSRGSTSNLATFSGDPDLRVISHDVTFSLDRPELDEPLDVVYHLASPASPEFVHRHPMATMRVASLGTENLLDLAQAHGARFLLASSSEVYGDPLVHPQPESYAGNVDPLGPRAPYAQAKRFAEAMTLVFARAGLNACIARPFNVYGPRLTPYDGRAVPTFVRQALAHEPLTVYGGSQTRSLCYVSDAVRGLRLLAESDLHGPFNLGNPDEITVLELAELVVDVTRSTSTIARRHGDGIYAPGYEPARRCPDISKARTELGWAPEVPLDEGIRRTAQYVRELASAA